MGLNGLTPVLYIFSLSVSAHESWHFYCMKWKNSDGSVRMYQDVIEQHIGQVVAQGYVIPSNGVMVLGQGFEGSLAGLNFWKYPLHTDTIQGMAAGIINVNGNLLQWRDFMTDHTSGDVSIVERSEAEIPGILTISNSKESESTWPVSQTLYAN